MQMMLTAKLLHRHPIPLKPPPLEEKMIVKPLFPHLIDC